MKKELLGINMKEEDIKLLKEKGIPLPPEDSKCQICGKKVSVLIPCNGFWTCKYENCWKGVKYNDTN